MAGPVVPTRRRARARLEVLRALADQTGALRALHDWFSHQAPRDSRLAGWMTGIRALDHDEFARGRAADWLANNQVNCREGVRLCVKDAATAADTARLRAVEQWARDWNLDAPWVRRWTAFALMRWEIARACKQSTCVCAGVDHPQKALELVLTGRAMVSVAEEHIPEFHDYGVEDLDRIGRVLTRGPEGLVPVPLPVWQRPIMDPLVVPPIKGSHPCLETEDAFLSRVTIAALAAAKEHWNTANARVEAEGVSLKEKRKLNLHCVWLVRYQVLGESAAEVIDALKDTPWSREKGWGEDAVDKQVRELADVIGLQIRPKRKRQAPPT